MSQSKFEAAKTILEAWKIVLQCIMFFILWSAAIDTDKRKRGIRQGMEAGLFILLNTGIGLAPCASWVRYVISAFIVFCYCMACYRRYYRTSVFIMLAFYNLHCVSSLTANSIYIKTTNVMLKSLDVFNDSYCKQMYYFLTVGMCVSLLCYIVLFMSMAVIFRRLVKGMAIMAWYDAVLLSVLNFVGSMITGVVNRLLVVKIDGSAFVLFDEKPDLLWKIPMISILIFAGEAALIYFWQKNRILLSERQKHFVEEQQVKAMKKRLEEAENFYGSIRKVRHEMKNHMVNIKGLAEAGQYEEIEKYVRKMDETMQKPEYKYMTGNAVTDVIINDKWRRAEKAGIRFEADFWYGGEIPVFDMGIILNNLLDNALEACEKLKPGEGCIRLTLRRRKQFLLLDVENSFDGTVQVQEKGPLPLTTKHSILPEIVTEHGIGLMNVRDIAERYLGGVSIKTNGDIFYVTVMLQHGKKEALDYDKGIEEALKDR